MHIKDEPLVSVLVCCYNYEEIVFDSIQSVIAQSYSNLEIIVCDNGSEDQTRRVIENIAAKDERIIPIYLEENTSFSGNFNACIDKATGDYIALHCGDDVMLRDKIKLQVQFLEAHLDHAVVLHAVEVFDSSSGRHIDQIGPEGVLTSPEDWFFRADYIPRERNSAFPPSSLFGRSDYLSDCRYDMRLPFKNEVLYAIDCFARNPGGKWACLPDVLSRYRRHDGNLSGSKEMNSALLEETRVLAAIVSSKYPEFSRKIAKVKNVFLFRALLHQDLEKERLHETTLRIEAGIGIYSFYRLCKLLRVFRLDGFLFKLLRGVIPA